jgi:hypothetical protein
MIPVKQRDDFAAYLREQRVVRAMSHNVARRPDRHWLFVETPGGWIRALALPSDRESRQKSINTALHFFRDPRNPWYRPGAWFVIRWKVDPQPGPNSWEGKQWDNYHKRYVVRR